MLAFTGVLDTNVTPAQRSPQQVAKLVFRSLNIIPTLSGASTAQNQSFHSF